jgi:hypothetical protein
MPLISLLRLLLPSCGSCPQLPRNCIVHHRRKILTTQAQGSSEPTQLSQSPLPIANTTTRLATMSAPAMTATMIMLPLLAGNLPRMT